MANISIRNVPPEVHAALQARAAQAGQSMQQYVADLLAREAQRETTTETTARWRAMAQERAARGTAQRIDAVELIRQAREDRSEQLLEVVHEHGRH